MDALRRTEIEPWELDLIRSIASRYSNQVDPDDLAGELSAFLLRFKGKNVKMADRKAYLTKSLLRRADRIANAWKRRRDRDVSLESLVSDGDEDIRLENLLSAEDADTTVLDGLLSIYEQLPREQRRLWDLLIEEDGDTAKVARRLGRPRTSVDYHIQKLRRLLGSGGSGR
ncbi:MAG: sigma-70 family RNA polymerase sigma factor [Elusimicrobia bacterium]|nr:sigma-70 family RNA polymerase sigma factor [Elusimicrobiota bacterium]